MEFNPNNKIVKLCLQAIGMEENGNAPKANELFLQAWNDSSQDFEKFIAAYFLAQQQKNISEKLKWLETTLKIALRMNNDTVKSAFPDLYSNIAKCYQDLNEPAQAKKNYELAKSFNPTPSDKGPFYHGTRADLQIGDSLTAGEFSNYKQELKMNHIYFTALPSGAGLAAELAKGNKSARVYIVEPTGDFEDDPNVTNKKFPGNPTRSYRSEAPLTIIDELKDWERLRPEELAKWRKKLAGIKGEIIN